MPKLNAGKACPLTNEGPEEVAEEGGVRRTVDDALSWMEK